MANIPILIAIHQLTSISPDECFRSLQVAVMDRAKVSVDMRDAIRLRGAPSCQ